MQHYKNAVLKDYAGDLKKRWYVYYYFRDPNTNKLIELREWVSSRIKTRTDRYVHSKQLINTINARLASGWSPFTTNARQKTLAEALNHIVSFKSRSCGLRAKHTYKNVANKFTTWLQTNNLQHLRCSDFNRYQAQTYFDSLIMAQGLSNRTFNNNLSALRTLFNGLVERDYCDFNVLVKIKKLTEAEAEINTFTKKEMQLIADHLSTQKPQLLLCAYFIYYCFIRPAELVRLRFKDVDIEKGIVYLSSRNSKNKKNKPVMIPGYLLDLYKKMQYQNQPADLFIFASGRSLLPGPKQTAPTRISEAWLKHVKQDLSIKKDIYLLKHTGNGDLFDSGADPRNIQLQNRHASLDETQVYLEKFRNIPSEKLKTHFLPFAS